MSVTAARVTPLLRSHSAASRGSAGSMAASLSLLNPVIGSHHALTVANRTKDRQGFLVG